jgi:GntR family transcriptional regulator
MVQAAISPRIPRYQQCQAHLLALIEGGELAPNQALPTEEQLCRTYGVSRVTVRRALSELIRLGLVAPRQGLGTFVTAPKTSFKSLSLMGTLDSVMSWSSDVTHRVLDRRRVSLPATLATNFEVPKSRVDRLELLYSRKKPFAHTAIFVDTSVAQHLDDELIAAQTTSIFHLIETHSASCVAYVDQRVDAVMAAPAVAELLEIKKLCPVLRAQRGYFSLTGALMHSAIVHYHPVHFSVGIRFIP